MRKPRQGICSQWDEYFKWFTDTHWIIKKVRYYEAGDIVRVFGDEKPRDFMIVATAKKRICLIGKNGQRWSDSCYVSDVLNITEEEIRSIVGKSKFVILKQGE